MASQYVPGAEFVPGQQPSYSSTEFFPSQGVAAPQAAPEYVPAYIDESAVFVPQGGAAGVDGAGATIPPSGATNVVTGSSNDFAARWVRPGLANGRQSRGAFIGTQD